MNFSCDKVFLSNALSAVTRAINSKSGMPILEGVFLKADKEMSSLDLVGYDLELSIKTSIECKVVEGGEIVVDAKLLFDIIKKMPSGNISFVLEEKENLKIAAGSAEFNITGFKADDYPGLPEVSGGKNLKINSKVLRNMVSKTLFAAAISGSKIIHTGLFFDVIGKDLNIVAVDGFRLALKKEKIENDENFNFVIPAKNINEVVKLIEDDEDVEITLSAKHIIFKSKEFLIISRLLEGEFMDYKNAVPGDGTITINVKTREFLECAERISLVITEQDRSPLKIIFDENEIKFSCITTKGRGVDSISAKIEGERLEIGVNSKLLCETLRAIEDDEIKITMQSNISPIKICGKNEEEFVYLVLPVRLNSGV